MIQYSRFPSRSATSLDEKGLARFINHLRMQNLKNKLTHEKRMVIEQINTGLLEWKLVWRQEKRNSKWQTWHAA